MHRTYSVLRLLGCWSLVIALMFLGGQIVSAQPQAPAPIKAVRFDQGPPEIKQEVPVVTMTVGTTQIYQAKDNLKRVENPNSKILNVTAVPKEFDKVRFEAIATGRVRVALTDQKDRVELIDVVIISDRVKELREAIARAVPTSSITVTSTDSGNTIVVAGTVLTTDDARVIQQLSTSVGGPAGSVINNVRLGGVQQVQLEVVVAEVNRSELRQMEFSWASTGQNAFAASLFGPGSFANVLTPGIAGVTSTQTRGNANLPFGILNNNSGFQGFLQALRVEQLAKVYAEPRVVTLSGRPGKINVGGEVPIILPTGVGAPPSVTYKQFGTTVNFLPIVLGNGKIHLEVSPEITAIDNTIPTGGAGIFAPAFKSRSANVAVEIEDGQTLAIGGLIQNVVTASIQRVPFLGDLPFLGVAFSSKSYQETETELIILVTVRLVDPIDCTKIPRYLPGRETRSPDDFELFLEGIMEAPRGPRNVSLHPRGYEAAYKQSSNGLYSGPGCANGNCAPGQLRGFETTAGQTRVNVARPMPSPSFPELPAITTSNPSGSGQIELTPTTPIPSLEPASPTAPTQREQPRRPVLPPVNSLPGR